MIYFNPTFCNFHYKNSCYAFHWKNDITTQNVLFQSPAYLKGSVDKDLMVPSSESMKKEDPDLEMPTVVNWS